MFIEAETEPISLANDTAFRTSNEDEWVRQMVEWISKTGAQSATLSASARNHKRTFQNSMTGEMVTC